MKFIFIKRINTDKNSIFYSLIKNKNNEIISFGRKHYRNRVIKKIKFDDNFIIIEDNNIYFKGEDPRCFEYNNKIKPKIILVTGLLVNFKFVLI